MAFIDDNNSGVPTGAGKDPLASLDEELASLKLTLGEMDTDTSADAPVDASAASVLSGEDVPASEGEGATRVSAPTTYRATAPADTTVPPTAPVTPRQPAPQRVSRMDTGEIPAAPRYAPPQAAQPAKKKPNTAIIVVALVLAALGAAGGFLYYHFSHQETRDPTLSVAGETVTINDSELGTVEIQTVDGVVLNTYDAENLVLEDNGYYSYYEDGRKVSEMGVDLSEYQTDIDFGAMKASGIDFVMLRIGGRYYSDEGGLYKDDAFRDYYDQAKAAGLKVGAYFFSQAASVEDAQEEARYTLELLDGLKLDYPVAFDWETIEDDYARTDGVTGEEITLIAEAFCDTISGGGYKTTVYASTSLMLQSYDFETMKDYTFWLADYREFPSSEKMYYNFTMWQYTTEGTVDGVNVPVDLNLCLKPE